MATEQNIVTCSLLAAADYTAAANQYKAVAVNAAGKAALVAGAGARADGILGNKPGADQPAEVITSGFAKAQVGAAIANAGVELMANAAGQLITATAAGAFPAANYVVAISLEAAGAAGEIIGVKLVGPYKI